MNTKTIRFVVVGILLAALVMHFADQMHALARAGLTLREGQYIIGASLIFFWASLPYLLAYAVFAKTKSRIVQGGIAIGMLFAGAFDTYYTLNLASGSQSSTGSILYLFLPIWVGLIILALFAISYFLHFKLRNGR